MNRKLMSSAMILSMAIGSASPVWAGEDHDKIGLQHDPVTTQSESPHRLTMDEAIRKVEEKIHGTVTSVRSTSDNGTLVYQIDVKKSDGMARVTVDAQTGKIITM